MRFQAKGTIKLNDLPLELALKKNRVEIVSIFLEQESKLRHGDENFKDYQLAGVKLAELYRTVDKKSILYNMLQKIVSFMHNPRIREHF